LIKVRNILIVMIATLLVLISVRESAPLFSYMFYRNNYLYQCQTVNHHNLDCQGRCVLIRQLALQDQKGSQQPSSVVPVQVKGVDLYFSLIHISNGVYFTVIQQYANVSNLHVDNLTDIATPPPKV